MPEAKDLPDDLKPLAFQQALSIQHDSFPRDMWGLEQELRRSVSTRWIWKVASVVSGLFIISSGAISFYIWRSPLALANGILEGRKFRVLC